MEEQEYIHNLETNWPRGEAPPPPSPELMALSVEAVDVFPLSPRLWILRGHLLQLCEEMEWEEALTCYRRAVELDPECAEGWQEVGFCLDVFPEELDGAEDAFRRAISLGAGPDSYYGLARVLAEKGDREAALDLLAPAKCPFYSDDTIREIQQEVQAGKWDP